MNVIFWILFGIDLLIFVFDFLSSLSNGGFKKAIKIINNTSDQIIDKTMINKNASKSEKVGKIIGLILVTGVVLYVTLGFPIISIVRKGLVIGVFVYFVFDWLLYVLILTRMYKHKAENLVLEFRFCKVIIYAIVRFFIIILFLGMFADAKIPEP